MANVDDLVGDLHAGRERFLALVADIRPDLHRYCARMTGSVSDGEDIVQETLARAYYALSETHPLPQLRTWLFQIAHTRSIDHLRRYDRRMGRSLDDTPEVATGDDDAESALARKEAVQSALSRFLGLPAEQRSCVILKDVLGHTNEEIGALLERSVPSVKAALHRGRASLRAQSVEDRPPPPTSPQIARYAKLFNARDWDGVRAMLAEDVRLDLVSRSQRAGSRDVGGYLTNYDALHDWHFVPASLEGREVLAAFRGPSDERPSYYVELTFANGRVAAIKDFRYVPYIATEAPLVLTSADSRRGR
jgi:RNA polymerase sigma-70 factor (ECF subfamily)